MPLDTKPVRIVKCAQQAVGNQQCPKSSSRFAPDCISRKGGKQAQDGVADPGCESGIGVDAAIHLQMRKEGDHHRPADCQQGHDGDQAEDAGAG